MQQCHMNNNFEIMLKWALPNITVKTEKANIEFEWDLEHARDEETVEKPQDVEGLEIGTEHKD